MRRRTRTHLNATGLWTVACRRSRRRQHHNFCPTGVPHSDGFKSAPKETNNTRTIRFGFHLFGAGVLLRCPASSSPSARLPHLPTAATRSGRCICHRQRSPRSPDSHLRFESVPKKQIKPEPFGSGFICLVQRSNPNPNHLSKWLPLHRLVLWCVCHP